jgi:uncharacterized RDD family membrane protein YckC
MSEQKKVNIEFKVASIGIRGLAMLLDYLILSLHFFPIGYLVKGTWLMTSEDHLWGGIFDPICAVFLVIIIAYNILFEGFFSLTPGKAILGIRIIGEDGYKIGFGKALIRFAGRMVDGIAANLVGVIIMLGNERRQRLGDKWARTLVVKKMYTIAEEDQPSKVNES